MKHKGGNEGCRCSRPRGPRRGLVGRDVYIVFRFLIECSRRRHDQKVLRSANTLMLQGSIEQALLFVAPEGSKLVVLHVPDYFSSKGAESLVNPSDAGPEDIVLVGEAQGLAKKKEDAEALGRPVYLGRPS